MLGDSLQPINSKTMREDVTGAIRRAILNGDLALGKKVNQVQIAQKLGTSRGPVREALRQLEEEGLIKSIPYRGTFVIEITPEYVKDLFAIRQVIEIFAVQCVIDRAQPDDLEKLRATVNEMQQAVAVSDLGRSSELDLQFHSLIYQSAHHDLLLPMWKSIEAGVRLCLAHGHRVDAGRRGFVRTHVDILAAIEAKDKDRASQLLRDHIQEAGEAIYNSWLALTELERER